MEVISTNGLTKSFGVTKAVNSISFQVNSGDIYGFLGLNGAGKTSLIRMLLGMIRPDSGSVALFGKRLDTKFDLWNEVGYLVETPYSYPNLSVTENLKVYYQLRQLKNPKLIPEIIEKLKLGRYQDVKAGHLSLGNQQRLGLAKALMHQPRLLILDEPINGLDPEGIVEVRSLLKELADRGSTIFLSSHILGEIAKIASRVGIIHTGRLVRELSISELGEQLIRKVLIHTGDNSSAIKYLISEGYGAVMDENNSIAVADQRAVAYPENLTKLLAEKGIPPKQVYLYTEDLEMYFLRTIRE
ncbi:ABC transporter ATP-binding protein [Cesiribacter sp. SM1]|uniref:ABC transporter ATP-binding protein n=1 Tax=Cesiribacter sp. SM1 TaxID=2861196 RepID=UPI001CD2E4BC